jgi:hypothetical protein
MQDLKQTFVTAQSAAALMKRDPRGIALEFSPAAYLKTPGGTKLLYLYEKVMRFANPEKED